MGRATGYTCDRPGCETFVLGANELPMGWINVRPQTDVKASGGVVSIDLCSNYCLAMAGIERHEAETGRKFSRSGPSAHPRTRGQSNPSAVGANLTRWHREGKHDNEPAEGCPECEKATAPS